MHCTNCGASLSDDAKFCGACGTKVSTEQITSTASSTETVSSSEIKWYRRNDTQAKNFTYLVVGLFSLFVPYGHVANISISPIQDIIGWIMLLAIFGGMYLNYIKRNKPLIFIFAFLALCSLLILVSALNVSSNSFVKVEIGIQAYLPIGIYLLGVFFSLKESKNSQQ